MAGEQHQQPNNSVGTGYLGRCRSVELFEKLNRLGEGTYGTVYRARDTESQDIVALKKVRIHSEKDGFPRSSLREIRLLKKLKHPNIVELLEVVCGRQPGSVFLVFEYCEHDVGALLDLMERPFSQAEVKCLVVQTLRAIAHLHNSFIIHRDLKLSNLLLTNRGVLKLADFGLAREFVDPPAPMTTNVVTLWYRAPELLLGAKVYTAAVDNWSAGCIFGELLLHRPLIPGKNEENQLQLMCALLGTPSIRIWPELQSLPSYGRFTLPSCDYNDLNVKFPDVPDSCLDLLNKLLTFNPRRRVTAAAAILHGHFTEEPVPLEPCQMPTWREHRNETANPRSVGVPVGKHAAKAEAAKAAAAKERSALFQRLGAVGVKRARTSIF